MRLRSDRLLTPDPGLLMDERLVLAITRDINIIGVTLTSFLSMIRCRFPLAR